VYQQPRANVADGVRPPLGKFFNFLSYFLLR
jgi:hypothetical protein